MLPARAMATSESDQITESKEASSVNVQGRGSGIDILSRFTDKCVARMCLREDINTGKGDAV